MSKGSEELNCQVLEDCAENATVTLGPLGNYRD